MANQAHQALPLWPDGEVPAALGNGPLDVPQLTVHRPANANGAAIIVNPGGGYRILASDHEGIQVAERLNAIGITAYVLRYRVGPRYGSEVSLLDAQRAIRLVRSLAAAEGIDAQRIGMLGFSAGAHLASMAGTCFDEGSAAATDQVDRVGCRPDFIVLCYAATDGALLGETGAAYPATSPAVDVTTPPTFLLHTHEDQIVTPQHSLKFYEALLAAGVPAELHVFGFGEHGLGLGVGDPDFRQWPELLGKWLRRTGFLSGNRRIALAGRVRLDGAAMGRGWITLLPDDGSSPIASARFNRGTGGRFEIDADHGPVPGPHRAEVFRESDIHPLDASGVYSLANPIRYSTEVVVEEGVPLELELTS